MERMSTQGMDGYIIESGKGDFLAQGLWWYPHEKLEDCFVFSSEILEIAREHHWDEKPKYAYPARYTPDEGVVITGKRFSI